METKDCISRRCGGSNVKRAKFLVLVILLFPALVCATGDSGHEQAGTIIGSVYCDRDEDGQCGCEEQGLKNVHIRLFTEHCGGTVLQTIHTDKDGNFSFHVQRPGEYFVMPDLRYVCGGRLPTTTTCREVALEAGETVTLAGFGYSLPGK